MKMTSEAIQAILIRAHPARPFPRAKWKTTVASAQTTNTEMTLRVACAACSKPPTLNFKCTKAVSNVSAPNRVASIRFAAGERWSTTSRRLAAADPRRPRRVGGGSRSSASAAAEGYRRAGVLFEAFQADPFQVARDGRVEPAGGTGSSSMTLTSVSITVP